MLIVPSPLDFIAKLPLLQIMELEELSVNAADIILAPLVTPSLRQFKLRVGNGYNDTPTHTPTQDERNRSTRLAYTLANGRSPSLLATIQCLHISGLACGFASTRAMLAELDDLRELRFGRRGAMKEYMLSLLSESAAVSKGGGPEVSQPIYAPRLITLRHRDIHPDVALALTECRPSLEIVSQSPKVRSSHPS